MHDRDVARWYASKTEWERENRSLRRRDAMNVGPVLYILIIILVVLAIVYLVQRIR